MKSKLGSVFKDISQYEKKESKSLSPESIALAFMKWKRNKTGEKVSYFRNRKRNGSEAWKYFEKLSELLTDWQSKYFDVPLEFYFNQHSKYVCADKNLYPHQLVSKRSYQYIYGKNAIDPTYVFVAEPLTYEDYEEALHSYAVRCGGNLNRTLDIVGFPPEFIELYRKRNKLVKKEE